MKRLIFCILLTLAAAGASAQVVEDFEGSFDTARVSGEVADVQIVEAEGDKALQATLVKKGEYPAVTIAARGGAWDLSGHGAVEATVTNTSDRRLNLAMRLDNPGDWKKSPWNVEKTSVKPGESKTIRVTFGRSWGREGYDLDPSKIKQIVFYAEKPSADTVIQIDDIRPIAAAASPAPSVTAQQDAETNLNSPPISGELYDFETAIDPSNLEGQEATAEVVPIDGGHALKASLTGGANYPGVMLKGPSGGWNLSPYAGVQVDVTNQGPAAAQVALRIDNPGDWKKSPWNVERVGIKPGETKTIQVTFGRSWGAPGFDLNPAKVAQALVYIEKPKQDTTLLIDDLRAFGAAVPREAGKIGEDGELLGFSRGTFDANAQAEGRGAAVEVEGDAVVATFSASEKWPGVYLMPLGKKWDLRDYESLQADITNAGNSGARVFVRVDNPGADGRNHCNTEAVTIPAGQTKTVKVTFGKSWGNAAFDLDEGNVVGVLVGVEGHKQDVTLRIANVRANKLRYAKLPEWLGERPPVEGDWVQTLDEDFDTGSLDTSIWTPRLVWDGPAKGELQRYTEDNVYVEDGLLVIKCEKEPGHQYDNPSLDTREYNTGAVTTLGKWTQTYGYFESRMKLPTARGLWPAFWMMPDRGEGHGDIWQRRTTEKGGMEIDVMEHLTEWGPGVYNTAAHWDGYGKGHKSWGTHENHYLPTEDGWHTFGLLWEPGRLVWYVDGKKMQEWKNERITDVPLYLKYTVQMGNWATKNVDDARLPDYFKIDWVRAWQLRERLPQ